MLRKELKTAKKVEGNLFGEITGNKKTVIDMNQDTYKDKRKAEDTNNRILALKAKHENEKDNFEKKIKDLQEKLK